MWMLLLLSHLSRSHAGYQRASRFLFPERLGKAQSTPWEVPAAGCDFPKKVIKSKQMVLAQAVRQDIGNWLCVVLSTGACLAADRGVEGQGAAGGSTEARLHANPFAHNYWLPSLVFCKYYVISL